MKEETNEDYSSKNGNIIIENLERDSMQSLQQYNLWSPMMKG